MAALTLREVLDLDPVRASEPVLLAGEGASDRPVRWVHSSEVYEGANFLDGGELLLTACAHRMVRGMGAASVRGLRTVA